MGGAGAGQHGEGVDVVFVEGLRVEALVGIHAHERAARQPLLLDIEMGTDFEAAAASDDIDQALAYDRLVACVRDFVAGCAPLLLERLAVELAARIESVLAPATLQLRVRKPDAAEALGCASVGVLLRRDRRAP